VTIQDCFVPMEGEFRDSLREFCGISHKSGAEERRSIDVLHSAKGRYLLRLIGDNKLYLRHACLF
jgi:hypothetical protein